MTSIYESVTQRILDQLEKGVIPWRKEWRCRGKIGLPYNEGTGKAYRGINILLLMVSGFPDARWLTFKQAQEKGGHIRKGEHGVKIVFWSLFDVERKDSTGGETETDRVPFVREYKVFNIDQVDGLPGELPLDMNPFEPIPAAQRLSDSYLTRAGIELKHGGARAFYHPALDSITLPDPGAFVSPDAYYSTLFHECGHSTGHKSRLDRKLEAGHSFGSEDYSREELVAEFTAAFLCAETGISSERVEINHVAYIQSWVKSIRNDPRMLVIAAQRAQKAADLIVGRKFEELAQ